MAQRIGQNKVLGLAIGDRSLVVAEASRTGGPARVTLAAPFPFPEGVGLNQPAALGAALGQFLRDRGFTARQVVVGVPARWVLSKPKDVPPADDATVAEALRLQVEGEFTQELRDLSFDYAGEASSDESRTVLLVALQGKHLAQVTALVEAAELQLAAVTPLGCVLGAAAAVAGGTPRQALVVSVGPGGVELAAVDGPAAPRVLRHLGGSAASAASLAVELRRATFGLGRSVGGAGGDLPAANGHPVNGAAANGVAANGSAYVNGNGSTAVAELATGRRDGWHLIVWDGAALNDASRRALADAAGARLEAGDLASLGVAPELSSVAPELAGAAALAVAGLSDEPLPADFLHSKLAEPKLSRVPRKAVILSAVGALVLLVIVGAYWRLASLQNQLADLTKVNENKAGETKTAGEFNDKVGYAQKWKQGHSRYIACWAELYKAIPGETPQAFIVNFTLKDKMDGSVRGKAADKKFADEAADRLRYNKHFANITYDWANDSASRATGSGQFNLKFTYVPEK